MGWAAPTLRHIDYSENNIKDMDVVKALARSPLCEVCFYFYIVLKKFQFSSISLQILCMSGNPVAQSKPFGANVVAALPRLKRFVSILFVNQQYESLFFIYVVWIQLKLTFQRN